MSPSRDLLPLVFAEEKDNDKCHMRNVDLYSGFVYKMLRDSGGAVQPIFASPRMGGLVCHRIEEVYNSENRIIRPAYKAVSKRKQYIPLKERLQ